MYSQPDRWQGYFLQYGGGRDDDASLSWRWDFHCHDLFLPLRSLDRLKRGHLPNSIRLIKSLSLHRRFRIACIPADCSCISALHSKVVSYIFRRDPTGQNISIGKDCSARLDSAIINRALLTVNEGSYPNLPLISVYLLQQQWCKKNC